MNKREPMLLNYKLLYIASWSAPLAIASGFKFANGAIFLPKIT